MKPIQNQRRSLSQKKKKTRSRGEGATEARRGMACVASERARQGRGSGPGAHCVRRRRKKKATVQRPRETRVLRRTAALWWMLMDGPKDLERFTAVFAGPGYLPLAVPSRPAPPKSQTCLFIFSLYKYHWCYNFFPVRINLPSIS